MNWQEVDAWRSVVMALAIQSGHDPDDALRKHQDAWGYDLEELRRFAVADEIPIKKDPREGI